MSRPATPSGPSAAAKGVDNEQEVKSRASLTDLPQEVLEQVYLILDLADRLALLRVSSTSTSRNDQSAHLISDMRCSA